MWRRIADRGAPEGVTSSEVPRTYSETIMFGKKNDGREVADLRARQARLDESLPAARRESDRGRRGSKRGVVRLVAYRGMPPGPGSREPPKYATAWWSWSD